MIRSAYFFALVFYALTALFFGYSHGTALFNFPLDDAWITQVYAHSLAFGHGFAYNTPGPQETGFTSPLWVILTAPFERISLISVNATVIAIKSVGVILGAISVFLTCKITQRLYACALATVIAGVIFSGSSLFLFSLYSGMGNALLVTLWLAAVYAFVCDNTKIACILIGLCAITRPEAILLVVPACIYCYTRFQKTDPIWAHYRPIFWCFLPMLLWFCFCFFATGHPLPATFYAKSTLSYATAHVSFKNMWPILTASDYAHSFVFYITLLLGIIFCCNNNMKAQRTAFLMLFIAGIVYLLGVIGTRIIVDDGYFSRRYVNPALIVFFAWFAMLLGKMASDFFSNKTPLTRRIAYGLLWVFFAANAVPYCAHLYNIQRHKLQAASLSIYHVDVKAGQWLGKHTPKNAVIGVNDAGAPRYFSHRHIVDLMGLNNIAIALEEPKAQAQIQSIGWLAIFTHWEPLLLRNNIIKNNLSFTSFHEKIRIGMRPAYYAICTPLHSFKTQCPHQSYMSILQKSQQSGRI
jgi:hypothetical protein